jgi:hypothetical protein
MRVVSSLAIALLLGFASSQVLPTKNGIQTLVLLDDYQVVESHSIFFHSLQRDGHVLHYEMIAPSAPYIKFWDDYHYDNIILMAPSVKGKSACSLYFFRS